MNLAPQTKLPAAVMTLLAAVGGLAGCRDMVPDVAHPGPAPYQQRRAELYDPYPEPDTGPELVGARPRDYIKPAPEVERARRFDSRFSRPAIAPTPEY